MTLQETLKQTQRDLESMTVLKKNLDEKYEKLNEKYIDLNTKLIEKDEILATMELSMATLTNVKRQLDIDYNRMTLQRNLHRANAQLQRNLAVELAECISQMRLRMAPIGDKTEHFSFLSAAEVDAMNILRKKIKRVEIKPPLVKKSDGEGEKTSDENTKSEILTRVMKKFVVLLQRYKKDKQYLSARVRTLSSLLSLSLSLSVSVLLLASLSQSLSLSLSSLSSLSLSSLLLLL